MVDKINVDGSLLKNEQPIHKFEYQKEMQDIGITLDITTGHIFYNEKFQAFPLNCELIFVRHGETYGNCGQGKANGAIDYALVKANIKHKAKRIYQGNVDTEINQLTEYGKQQAITAAERLKSDLLEKGWKPDAIFVSPLARAKDTALPFITQNKFEDRCVILEKIREMSFGAWENRRICDIPSNDPCHLFYREQNALVKSTEVYANGLKQDGECFCDVLIRAHDVFYDLNNNHATKKTLMFSHSMFGAACCILLGKGQRIENGEYLAFDGQRANGKSYTIPLATPFILHTNISSVEM